MATVLIAATVIDIPNVDDVGGQMQVNLGLTVKWFDPRLNYLNLVPNVELNVLSSPE